MVNIKLENKDIELISKIINGALSLKVIERKIGPHKIISNDIESELKFVLKNMLKNLEDLSIKFGLKTFEPDKSESITSKIKDGAIFYTSKKIGKKLKEFGFEKRRYLMISSPLTIEDFKKINPKINNDNINMFRRQIEINWNDIKKFIENNMGLNFFFIENENNKANQLIKNRLIDYFLSKNYVIHIINEKEIVKD